MAVFDQLGSQSAHRNVLLDAVAVRHDDRRAQSMATRGVSDTLAVVPARGRDDAFWRMVRTREVVHVDQPAAQLECPYRRMVLMLDPDLRATALRKRRPANLRCRTHHRAYDSRCVFDLFEPWQYHWDFAVFQQISCVSSNTSCAAPTSPRILPHPAIESGRAGGADRRGFTRIWQRRALAKPH